MVEQKPVNVNFQMLFSVLPLIWIWAFYRIEKLRMGIVFLIIVTGLGIAVQMLLPFPYGLIISYGISLGVPIWFIRKYSIKWNSRF